MLIIPFSFIILVSFSRYNRHFFNKAVKNYNSLIQYSQKTCPPWLLFSSKQKKPLWISPKRFFRTGIVLSSRAVASQVLSTPMSLTSVFGMGTGVSSSLSTPVFVEVTFQGTFKIEQSLLCFFFRSHFLDLWSSPRPISTR